MKRKNKDTTLTVTEEISLRRYLCEKIQKRNLCCANYLLASDVWKREELKEIWLDKALKKHMGVNPEVSKHAIVAYSTYDMSNLDGWIALRFSDSMPASGYLLEEDKAEEALVPMRKEYLDLKKSLKDSKYRVNSAMVPTVLEESAQVVELYSTPLGKVIFWNAWNWILVTDLEYEKYMLDVRDHLLKVDQKRGSKAMLAVNLGFDYDEEFPDDSSEGISASDFFNSEVLTWTQAKLEDLEQAVRDKKKSML